MTNICSHLELAHAYWKGHVKEGACVVDATCGNGHDTLFLAELVGSRGLVIGLDIQEQALANTRRLLKENLHSRVLLFQQSHETFPEEAFRQPVSLIVYNLGYLPGGDKRITTQTATTLASLEHALALVSAQGMVSITCYPGHPEGETEEKALMARLQDLPLDAYSICHHRWLNRRLAPSLLLIQKKH